MLYDTSERYGGLSQFFHWALTLLVIGMLILGWVMVYFPEHSAIRGTLTSLHMSTGLLTLALAVLFVLWRLANARPSNAVLPAWQRALAGITHGLLFIVVLVQPLAGIVMAMASGGHIGFYGLFKLPIVTPHSKALAHGAHFVHTQIMPWVIVALVALHVIGALYHQFVRRDTVMARMLPGGPSVGTARAGKSVG